MHKVAILASGSGSTAEAFIRSIHEQHHPLDVRLVIANNPDAFVLTRIARLNDELGCSIETRVINAHSQASTKPQAHGQQTIEEQEAILAAFETHQIELVVLLGYMKLIGPKIIEAYGWLPHYTSIYQARMLNTHPGILPDTIGTHGLATQEFTLKKGMKEGGQSLHLVSADYDMGPLIAEHRVNVEPGDNAETLFARVQAVEKQHIASDIADFAADQDTYRGTRNDSETIEANQP